MNKVLEEGQTVLVLDKEDIAFVIKPDGTHEAYISSEVDEDAETEQNLVAVMILAVLKNPEKYEELTIELLLKALDKKS